MEPLLRWFHHAAGLLTRVCWGGSSAWSAPTPQFAAAQPLWPEGREKEKNLSVGFRASFTAPAGQRVLLRATGATVYRVFLNGHFLGHGPACGPRTIRKLNRAHPFGLVVLAPRPRPMFAEELPVAQVC